MSDIEQSAISDRLSPLIDAVPRLQAQAILHVGHNKLYKLLRRGELEAVRDGNRTFILIESLKQYQANRPRATYKPPVPPQNNFHTQEEAPYRASPFKRA